MRSVVESNVSRRAAITGAVGAGLLLASALAVIPLWVRLAETAASWHPGSPVDLLGRDFGVFRTAAHLAAAGRWHDLYDPVASATAYRDVTGLALPPGGPVFPYPPFTALALTPLALLSLGGGLVVWSVVGLLVLFGGLRLLGARWWTGVAVLLTMPAYATAQLGQNALLTVGVLAFGYWLIGRGRRLTAGLVLGLLLLKPQFALGFAVWWLATPSRHRRELAGAAGTAAVLVAPSLLLAGDGWRSYLQHFGDLTNPATVTRAWYWSSWDFTWLLVPGRTGIATGVWATLVVAVMVLLIALVRRRGEEWLGFAAAVTASVLVTPHLVVYDWTVLLVPAVIMWKAVPRTRAAVLSLVGGLAVVAALAGDLVNRQLAVWGRAFSPAFPVLVAAVATACLAVTRTGAASPDPPSTLDTGVSVQPERTSRRNLPV